jgi:hypothetical protein
MFGEKYGGPPLAQYYLPTRYQQILVENDGGPTMAHP